MSSNDLPWVQAQLAALPFVTIEGIANVRSLGNYHTDLGLVTKQNYIFRSGHISGITPEGRIQMRNLGIKKVFDLRANIELSKFGSPPPELGSEFEYQRIPVLKDEDYSPQGLTLRSKLYASGTVEGILEIYSDVLDNGSLAFKTIFEHIRDRPDAGFLFHCTAGKDRTGVLAALILKAAGVDDDIIATDYELTAVGLEPGRAATEAKFLSLPDFAGNVEAVRNVLSCRRESMVAFLNFLEEKHGGIRKYLQEVLQFSAADIDTIRNHIVRSPEVQ